MKDSISNHNIVTLSPEVCRPVSRLCAVIFSGGVRGLRQPARPLHILFPLHSQHKRAFRVENRLVQDADQKHVYHRHQQTDGVKTATKASAFALVCGCPRYPLRPANHTGSVVSSQLNGTVHHWTLAKILCACSECSYSYDVAVVIYYSCCH